MVRKSIGGLQQGRPPAPVPSEIPQDAMAALQDGGVSREQFAEVAVACFQQLQRAACRLAGNAADADDLVQETYRLAFQHCRELRHLHHCGAWLRRILRRQAVTRLRRQLARPRQVLLDEDRQQGSFPNGGDVTSRLALREVYAAIQSLPAELRSALTLSEINGFRYAEIAAITACPIGTVRSRIARARERLMISLRLQAEECGLTRERERA